MLDKERVLERSAVRAYYDWFGKRQDSQGFYENPALDDLIAHASFQDTRSVFEFGCGTGKFAARLLEKHLSFSASYLGCDISPVMVELAKQRLEPYEGRAKVALSDGSMKFSLSEHSVDRVVSSYVLDLLSEEDIRRFLSESLRVIKPGGKVCLSSLTKGVSLPSWIVSTIWMTVFRVKPAIVGGCRPIRIDSFMDPLVWMVVYRKVVTPFGVPSEVLVLEATGMPNNELEATR